MDGTVVRPCGCNDGVNVLSRGDRGIRQRDRIRTMRCADLWFWRIRLWFAGVFDDLFERGHFAAVRTLVGVRQTPPQFVNMSTCQLMRACLSLAHVHLTTMAEFNSPLDSSFILMGTDQILPLSRPLSVTSDTRFLSLRLTVLIQFTSVDPPVYVVGPVPTYARDDPQTCNARVLRHLIMHNGHLY